MMVRIRFIGLKIICNSDREASKQGVELIQVFIILSLNFYVRG